MLKPTDRYKLNPQLITMTVVQKSSFPIFDGPPFQHIPSCFPSKNRDQKWLAGVLWRTSPYRNTSWTSISSSLPLRKNWNSTTENTFTELLARRHSSFCTFHLGQIGVDGVAGPEHHLFGGPDSKQVAWSEIPRNTVQRKVKQKNVPVWRGWLGFWSVSEYPCICGTSHVTL